MTEEFHEGAIKLISSDPSMHDFRKEFMAPVAQMSSLTLVPVHKRVEINEKSNKDRFNYPDAYNEKDPNRVHSLRQ